MRKLLTILSVFALVVSVTASLAHAHVGGKNTSQQVELSADQDNTDNGNTADPLCDLHCGHHHHLVFSGLNQTVFPDGGATLFGITADHAVSSPIYGLKRPPRA